MGAGETGQFALLFALAFTVYALAALILGERRGLPELVESGRRAFLGIALFQSVAGVALFYAFISNDFSLRYVAETSSRSQPLIVTLTGFWGGQAGSLLFWSWMLSLFAALAVHRSARSAPALANGVAGTLAVIQLFFLYLVTFVSSPFERLPIPPFDGRGLNPLLWDPGMRIHPPLLLTGYMSFAIPFAFAIAALLTGQTDRRWLQAVRPWMLLAWGIQSAGLLAGAWWAYHVLGWGGYWGWDPVENAALLPWITATAFLHSIQVQEQRGLLPTWNFSLVIATFALAVFGTFVVRSGVLSSVHSFALSAIGPYFFVFLGLVLIVSIGLLLYRLPQFPKGGSFDAVTSREGGFILNNFLLVAITAATFWGTIFPLLSEAVRGVKVSVGPPFYKQVNGPLLLALLALMGIGPLLAWRRTRWGRLSRYVRWPAVAGVVIGALFFVLEPGEALAAVAYGVSGFVAGTIVVEFVRGVRLRQKNAGEGMGRALVTLIGRNRRRYGGYIVHLGIVLLALGVISSTAFQQEEAATLSVGQSMRLGPYQLTYLGMNQRQEPDRLITSAMVQLQREGRPLGTLEPERRTHAGWEQQPITGIVIRTVWPWAEDVYVMVTGWDESGAATFRAFLNPGVVFLWWGGLVLFAGTIIAGWPTVRRTARLPSAAEPREAVAHAR